MIPIVALSMNDNRYKVLAKKLLDSLYTNSVIRMRNRSDGSTRKEVNFRVSCSKPIIDEIDNSFSDYYKLTEEELDFIINYDIKYRMGIEEDDE